VRLRIVFYFTKKMQLTSTTLVHYLENIRDEGRGKTYRSNQNV